MDSDTFRATVAKCLDQGDFSDLTLICKGREFKVHKAIVCTQSKFLYNAVKDGRFKEGRDGVIDFAEDEDHAVEALVHYLYHGNYLFCDDNASEPNSAKDGIAISEHDIQIRVLLCLTAHLDVFAIANRMLMSELQALAIGYIQEALETAWGNVEFPNAIEKAYSIAPPGEEGRLLREMFIKAFHKHHYVLGRSGRFEGCQTMIMNVPEFGREFISLMAKGHVDVHEILEDKDKDGREDADRYRCEECNMVFFGLFATVSLSMVRQRLGVDEHNEKGKA